MSCLQIMTHQIVAGITLHMLCKNMSVFDRRRCDLGHGGYTVLYSGIYLRIETCISRNLRPRLATLQSNERTFFVPEHLKTVVAATVHVCTPELSPVVVQDDLLEAIRSVGGPLLLRRPFGSNTYHFGRVDESL